MTDPVVKVEQLEGAALGRALAEALGWAVLFSDGDMHMLSGYLDDKPRGWARLGEPYVIVDGADCRIPPFATSLDALAAGEARLIEAGLWLRVEKYWNGGVSAKWYMRPPLPPVHILTSQSDTSEAEARARACLLALRALGEVEGERAG